MTPQRRVKRKGAFSPRRVNIKVRTEFFGGTIKDPQQHAYCAPQHVVQGNVAWVK
jgi:hypothetical protein